MEVWELEGITRAKSHMGAFGMYDSEHQGGGLVKKPKDFSRMRLKLLMNWKSRVVRITDMLCL